jgi:DNA repair exonuclease SbcCD ATPase subunit
MRGNIEEVESLRTEVEYLKEEIKQLREENTAKEIILQAANKTNELLERELEVKVKSVEQSSEILTKVKNSLNEREQVIIELKHKLDLDREQLSALKQHIKDLGDKEDTPTNITVLTSSAKDPPKFKCKYCGKKFSKLTLLEGHIKDYHIPVTTSLRSGQNET